MSATNSTKQNVLVVEDDNVFRKLIIGKIKRSGYQVIEAADARIAKDLFITSQDSIGLVVSDGRLPGVNGVEFLEFVRSHSKVPFILVTGNGESFAEKARLLGANEIIAKPFDPDFFADLLKRYMQSQW